MGNTRDRKGNSALFFRRAPTNLVRERDTAAGIPTASFGQFCGCVASWHLTTHMETGPDNIREGLALDSIKLRGVRPSHEGTSDDQYLHSDDTADNHAETPPGALLRLNVVRGAHRGTKRTAALVEDIGGLPALERCTSIFYQRCYADPHVDAFIRSHEDPHGQRFAAWIAEGLGYGTPWSEERARRERVEVSLADGMPRVVAAVAHDRTSAHGSGWHSPKQKRKKSRDMQVPEPAADLRFEDCRVWMRLHFWAAREEGVLDYPAFADYYCRFIGHFVSVYQATAPPFARESMRWSAHPANIQTYLDAGRRMPEIMGLAHDAALATLPAEERAYTGSKESTHWPYEL